VYDADFVIFRASDTSRIPTEVQNHFERAGIVGKWVVMKERDSARP
jgi:hypothetical protein